MRRILIPGVIMALAAGSLAEDVYRDAGASSWPFLKIDAGASAAALGGTGLLHSGALAAFSNPALLAFQEASIVGSHNSWFGRTSQNLAAAVIPWGPLGASAALRVLNTGGLEYRESPSSEPVGTFGVTDVSLHAAFGARLGPGFALGAGLKYVREKVWTEESSGVCFDLGLLASPVRGLTLAAAAQNMGPGVVMDMKEFRLPRTIRAGAAFTMPTPLGGATVSGEILKPLDNRPRGGVGLEYQPLSWAAMRVGLRINDPSASLTAGMGLSWSGWTLDYAYVPGNFTLGDTHRFTLTRSL